MRTWNYLPDFKAWILDVHQDKAKEISMCLDDPVVGDLVWDHYWDDYLEAVAGIHGSLFLIETMIPGEDEFDSGLSRTDLILG